jgi:hypothetical protein
MDEFDFGDMSGLDFGDFDLSGLENMDLSGLADMDLSGLQDLDLSGLGDLDLSGLEGMDLSSIDLGDLEGLDLNSIAELGIGDFDLNDLEGLDSAGGNTRSLFGGGESGYSPEDQQGLEDLIRKHSGENELAAGDFDQAAPPANTAELMASMSEAANKNGANTDFESLYTAGMTPEQIASRKEYMDSLGSQNFGSSVDMEGGMKDFNANLKDIMENRDGFTSQWQSVGYLGDRVMVADDGTGIKFNPITGSTDKLTASQVSDMIRKGQINTNKSGYNAATGGDKFAPGGGTSVVLKDGSKGTLVPGGRVIDSSGTVIGDSKDVASKVTTDGTGKTITTNTKSSEQGGDWMKYIMLLMALDAMRNKGGGSSGAVIPSLSASRGTTPYAEAQKAPGYRPGQGGVQYFGPTVYRAAGGGIGSLDAAGGRLLRGPGDGVSDDIVAQIGDNQPARLADGEYVLDARTVSEIGNGSTDAGADKIAEMVERIHSERRNAKRGEPSNADKKLLA